MDEADFGTANFSFSAKETEGFSMPDYIRTAQDF